MVFKTPSWPPKQKKKKYQFKGPKPWFTICHAARHDIQHAIEPSPQLVFRAQIPFLTGSARTSKEKKIWSAKTLFSWLHKAGYGSHQSKVHKSALNSVNKQNTRCVQCMWKRALCEVIKCAQGKWGAFVLGRWYWVTLCPELLVQNHIHFSWGTFLWSSTIDFSVWKL